MPGNTAPEIVEIAPADRLTLVEAAHILGVTFNQLSNLLFEKRYIRGRLKLPTMHRISRYASCLSRSECEHLAANGFKASFDKAKEAEAQELSERLSRQGRALRETLARKRAARGAPCHASP